MQEIGLTCKKSICFNSCSDEGLEFREYVRRKCEGNIHNSEIGIEVSKFHSTRQDLYLMMNV